MANRIDEVWYAYNAKGKKIPPYKSMFKQQKKRSLVGRIWHTYRSNWKEITGLIVFGIAITAGLMIVIIHITAAIIH
jgi:hypothetical protein